VGLSVVTLLMIVEEMSLLFGEVSLGAIVIGYFYREYICICNFTDYD